MNPIIFLDFDGVLNSAISWENYKKNHLAPEHINILNQITDLTNSRIVISSSWRYGTSLTSLRAMLKRKGVKAKVIGKTPELRSDQWQDLVSRGQEIQVWLDDNPHDRFIILDDGDDMGHLTPYLIQTDHKTGLTKEHIEPAVRLLTGNNHET